MLNKIEQLKGLLSAEDLGSFGLEDVGYVKSVTLNGKPLLKPELHHADLKAGSTLRFVIGTDAVSWVQP